ncbi:unnamed protein product [Urochloa humidicola]
MVVAGADDMPAELTVGEVNDATASFSAARVIGEGEHAKVYRASLRTGRAAAAKRLWRSRNNLAVTRQQLSAAASRLRHRNVARLLGYTVSPDLSVLLYEFADLGTLHDALHGGAASGRPGLSWAQRVRVALDAARGLAYLHGAVVAAGAGVHREFRSSKVLLFPGLRAKVADGHNIFHQLDLEELSYAQSRHMSTLAHLPAEELIDVGRMTPKSDVFSFGVVLLELLTGAKAYDDTRRRDQGTDHWLWSWAAPFLAEGRVEECIDPKLGNQYPRAGAHELGRIAMQCLRKDLTSRPSMNTVARLINNDVIVRDQLGRRVL